MDTNSKRTRIVTTLDGPYQQEGFDLMAAVFEVHNELGGGLAKEVYQECLEAELAERQITFFAKPLLPIFYKGKQLRKCYVPDLYAFDGIIVELKSVAQLLPEHEAQIFNYMRLAQKRVGYLINMAPLRKIEWRRFVL